VLRIAKISVLLLILSETFILDSHPVLLYEMLSKTEWGRPYVSHSEIRVFNSGTNLTD
jgi:hypothetical protein